MIFFCSVLVWSQLLSRPTLLPMLSVFCFYLYSLSCTFHISLNVLTSSMNIYLYILAPSHNLQQHKNDCILSKHTRLYNPNKSRQCYGTKANGCKHRCVLPIFNVLLEASLTQGGTRYNMFNSLALVHRVQCNSDVLSNICFYVLLDARVCLIQLPHSIGHRCFICLKVDINVHKTVKLVL